MNSKKADASVTIFVTGVIALVILALISFAVVSSKAKKINGAEIVEWAYTLAENYDFYISHGYSESEAREILGIVEDSDGVYVNISNGDVNVRYYVKR